MYRHLLILPDGREIFSGDDRDNAIASVTLTRSVNAGQELNPGSACAAEMKAELITPEGALNLSAGDRVILQIVEEGDIRRQVGVFYLEKPVRTSAHTLQLLGYDGVSLLDRDLTGWLAGLEQWPYSVLSFAKMVCEQCGVTLLTEEIPNGDFYIQPFSAEGVTGRRLIQWLGQIAGRFCRADAYGNLEFAWYTPNDTWMLTPENCDGGIWYYQGGLEYADYRVAAVEKVQLRQSAKDVGMVWPDAAGELNTYIIENNPMLAAQAADTLLPVARTLYAQMQAVDYTPCKVTIPATPRIDTGDILMVRDGTGKIFIMWVMKKTANGLTDTLECTGSHRRDSTTAVNNLGYRTLSGKVLELQTNVDGLKAENRDVRGNLAAIGLDLDGIRSRVESQESKAEGITGTVSSLTQTARSLSLQLQTIRQDGAQKVTTGVGYTFDDKGLQISRTDSNMANLLDHTGMYVRRNGEVVLQANNLGVQARDVSVGNYLIIGENARIEDYGGNRTACFYIG